MNKFNVLMMRFQAFLLRNNLMGPAGDILMSMEVKGRRSGISYSIPVGYLKDNNVVYAINPGGKSNWYKNIDKHPSVILAIKGEKQERTAVKIVSEDEIKQVFDLYKEKQSKNFRRLFFVEVNASEELLNKAMMNTKFVKFQ